MENGKTFFFKNLEKFPFKLLLCYNWIIIKHEYITKEPIFKLLFNSNEIFKLKDKKELSKFYYYNRNKIAKILDEEEAFIQIELDDNNMTMSFYFYLSLIIKNNIHKIDYTYSIELLRKINNQRKIIQNEFFKKIMISKIIFELIDNYRNCEDYAEKEENELIDIEEENNQTIIQNLNIFKELKLENISLEDIKKIKIDEIYIELIIALIKYKNLGNSDYIINSFNQLDLENIFLTEKMKKDLFLFLEDEQNISNYNILQLEDLLNNDKLIFFFILFKYLLKESFYIFHINFLYKIRISIIKKIKSKNYNNFLNNYNRIDDNIKKNKIKFVLKSFLDSDYYLKKLNLENNNINSNNINDNVNNDDDNNNEIINVIFINDKDNDNDNNNNDNDNNNNNNNYNINNNQNNINNIEINNYTIYTISSKSRDISNPLSRISLDEAHKKSNKELDNINIEDIKIDIDIMQMLTNSYFKLQINGKVENRFIKYVEIKIGNKEYKNIRKIKEITFDEKADTKLLNSYNKYITTLNKIEERIKNEYKKSCDLEIELKFEKPKVQFDNMKYYDIDCYYKIPNVNNIFKDENLLNNKNLIGIDLFINEINIEN